MLSLNLAILNLLPLPPLDGGKIVLCLLEKVHPQLARLHFPLAIFGWVCLLGLMGYTTVLDIARHVVGYE
jgi:regulator of sigma E protease